MDASMVLLTDAGIDCLMESRTDARRAASTGLRTDVKRDRTRDVSTHALWTDMWLMWSMERGTKGRRDELTVRATVS